MNMGLRTTIFWNMGLVMLIAIGLIAVVAFRSTEQGLYRQADRQHRQLFDMLAAGIALGFDPGAPAGQGFPPEKLQQLLDEAVALGLCSAAVFADAAGEAIAGTGVATARQFGAEKPRHGRIDEPVTSVITPDGVQNLSGPVQARGRGTGSLNMAFPLDETRGRIGQTVKVIFLYIVLSAVVLTAFGTFLLTRSVVRPLNRVIRLTETIAEQHSNVPLFFSRKNEIGKLAGALTSLSDNLQRERCKVQQQVRDLEAKNRELQGAYREILQSEKLASVGKLAAGIAHEIGNPAGIILGYIHMLRGSSPGDGEREEYLARMEAETERVARTVRDLMEYAHPSSHEKKPFGLNGVVQDAWAMVSCQEGFEHIRPVVRCAEQLPPLVADEHQIRQLLINLMLNARDAMRGEGTLEIVTGQGPDGSIAVTVSDTGEGIPEGVRERIFEPFFTTKNRGGNAGLGLANVQRIVAEAGGSIAVTSTPGRGTAFELRFPVGHVADAG